MPTVRVPVIKDENSYYPFFRSTDPYFSTGGLIIDLDVTSSVFGIETIPAIPPVGEGWPGIKPTVQALKVIDPQGFVKWLNITPAAYAALIDAIGAAPPSVEFLYGSGAPASTLGEVGDLYIDNLYGAVYKKTDSADWTYVIGIFVAPQVVSTTVNFSANPGTIYHVPHGFGFNPSAMWLQAQSANCITAYGGGVNNFILGSWDGTNANIAFFSRPESGTLTMIISAIP